MKSRDKINRVVCIFLVQESEKEKMVPKKHLKVGEIF